MKMQISIFSANYANGEILMSLMVVAKQIEQNSVVTCKREPFMPPPHQSTILNIS